MEIIPESSTIRCPYCSSNQIIKKGTAERVAGYKQVYKCKSCHKRFCEGTKNPEKELSDEIVEAYLFNVGSLDSLIKVEKLEFPRTTLYRKIMQKACNCPDWPELTAAMKAQGILGSFMGVDTTILKIKSKKYVYFHVVDITSGNPIAYAICERKDVTTLEPILHQLKRVGYNPELVVVDLSAELIAVVEKVYLHTRVQGCLFHLKMWLDKELPTKKRLKGIDKQTVRLWLEVKKLILYAVHSQNWEIRRRYLTQLNNLSLDEKAKSVVMRFYENLVYYNTLDRLKVFTGNITDIIYNNTCECHIGLVRNLERKMRGFKSNDSAIKLLKLFWSSYIKRKAQIPHTPDDQITFSYTPPLPLFDNVNITEFSIASGFSREAIGKTLKENGYEVIGDYAFTKTYLQEIRKQVIKMRKPRLVDVAKILGNDHWTTLFILQKAGFRILYNKLDMSDAIISTENISDLQNHI